MIVYKMLCLGVTITLVVLITNSNEVIANELQTSLEAYPFAMFLYNKTVQKGLCGGTLITPKCILTAAHCVFDKNLNDLNVREGHEKNTLLKEAKIYRFEAIAHPLYEGQSATDSNVAVVRLNEPISSTLVELDFSPIEANDTFTIIGWDRNKKMENVNSIRMVGYQNYVPMDVCKSRLGKLKSKMLTNNIFCAWPAKRSDTGIGNTGGPALRNGKQVGVTLWSTMLYGGAVQPAVYVRLGAESIKKFIFYALDEYCSDDAME